MHPKYTKVRARSANKGSGTVGWSLAALVDACFLMNEEDIAALSWQFRGNQWWSKRGGAGGGKWFIRLDRNRAAALVNDVHLIDHGRLYQNLRFPPLPPALKTRCFTAAQTAV